MRRQRRGVAANVRVGFVGGQAEHGDDGFAVEHGVGSDGHDRPGIRIVLLGDPLRELVEAVTDLRHAPALGVVHELVVGDARFASLGGCD